MASYAPIGPTSPIIPAVAIDLRSQVSTRPWVLTLAAWTLVTLAAAAVVLLAGDELLVRSRQLAGWWTQRPEGVVLGAVVLLTAMAAGLATRDRRVDADKPVYDVR